MSLLLISLLVVQVARSDDVKKSPSECSCYGETGYVWQAYWDKAPYGDKQIYAGCIEVPYKGVRKEACYRKFKKSPEQCTCHGDWGFEWQGYWDKNPYGKNKIYAGCIGVPYKGVRKEACYRLSEVTPKPVTTPKPVSVATPKPVATQPVTFSKTIGENVCFGAKGNKYGEFSIHEDMNVNSLSLKWKSGGVGCSRNADPTHWGCRREGKDDAVIFMFVTDDQDIKVFPTKNFKDETQYTLKGFSNDSPILTFSESKLMKKGNYRLWYGEDLVGFTEGDNFGEVCADISVDAEIKDQNYGMFCSKEGQMCDCKGTVYYGPFSGKGTVESGRMSLDILKRLELEGNFVKKEMTGRFKCGNAVFGDPAHKIYKQCICVSGQTVVTPKPVATPMPAPKKTPKPVATPKPVSTPKPVATPKPEENGETCGSDYTVKMMESLQPAARDMTSCDQGVRYVRGRLALINGKYGNVKTVIEKMTDIVRAVDDILESLTKGKPSFADVVGKVPKVGVFIKMAITTSEQIVDKVLQVATRIEDVSNKVAYVLTKVHGTFESTSQVTSPIAEFLDISYSALEEAHKSATKLGYKCNTKASNMEAANKRDFFYAETPLAVIQKAGDFCRVTMNPMGKGLDALLAAVVEVGDFLAPVTNLVNDVNKFVTEVNDFIKQLKEGLEQTTAAQCVLEIYEPVKIGIAVTECPVATVIDAAISTVIDAIRHDLEVIIKKTVSDTIKKGLETFIPKDFSIVIPDVTKYLPFDNFFEVAGNAVAPSYPKISSVFTELGKGTFPMEVNFSKIGDEIAVSVWQQIPLPSNSNNVCIEAWKALTNYNPDFKACVAMLTQVANVGCDAARDAKKGHDRLLDAAQDAFDDANYGLKVAQDAMSHAQRAVNDEKKKFDHAIKQLEDSKADCEFVDCDCKWCNWWDWSCHGENTWCCPLVPIFESCKLGITIAQGHVHAVKASYDLAKATMEGAKLALEGPKVTFQATKDTLWHYKAATGGLLENIANSCAPLNWVSCEDKISKCSEHEKNGGCRSSNKKHVYWRSNCAKTCGYCNDARYNPQFSK